MKLGIGISEDLPVSVQQRLAADVEAAGFASLWTNEASGRDALLVCQAWGAATTDLQVGVGVVPIWTRSPAQLAMAAATLQEATGGRFVLGLGVSHPATMGRWHGAEVTRPLTAARETLTILRQADAGTPTDVDGEVRSSRRFRLAITPRPPALRLHLAAMGPRMLALAGTQADGVLLNWSSPPAMAAAGEQVRAAAARAGRDPADVEVAAYVRVAVADDADAARAALAAQIGQYAALPAYAQHFAQQGLADAVARVKAAHQQGADATGLAEALGSTALEALGFAGAPTDDVGGFVDRLGEAGLDHAVLRVVVVGEDPVDGVAAAIRAFDRFTAPARTPRPPAG